MPNPSFYKSRGKRDPRIADQLPPVDLRKLTDPEHYQAPPALAAAVNVALTLGMPLLLTGEPGSGKSGVAESLAWQLGLDPVLRFPVKSDTESRDLFYRFDTVGRFHAANAARQGDSPIDPGLYISFEPLGRAILDALSREQRARLPLPAHKLDPDAKRRRAVVLIDEIDKAPRDVPNDILVEIERMQFDIPELAAPGGDPVRVALEDKADTYRPIVIFTSNSEKALPDPFLRRCVYHHLSFPPFAAEGETGGGEVVTVESIVRARLGERFISGEVSKWIDPPLGLFRHLRAERTGLARRPSLAELLDWLNHLMPQGERPEDWSTLAALTTPDPKENAHLEQATATLLLKDKADHARVAKLIADWRALRGRGGRG